MERSHSNARVLKGFSVVEVLLASSLFVIIVTGLVGAYLYGEQATAYSGNIARATTLADEGLEAARSMRDTGFTTLIDGTYGLSTLGNQWAFLGASDTSGIFTRTITISSIDTVRKSIVAQVSWQENPSRTASVSLETDLTNWQDTVGVGTCNDFAISQGYTAGTCRQNAGRCGQNGETYLPLGDPYCPGTGGQNVCCGAP